MATSPQPKHIKAKLPPPEIPPAPNPATFDWPTAQRHLLNGQKITKLEWKDSNTYVQVHEGNLRIHLASDGMLHDMIVTDGDMGGTDWVIIGPATAPA